MANGLKFGQDVIDRPLVPGTTAPESLQQQALGVVPEAPQFGFTGGISAPTTPSVATARATGTAVPPPALPQRTTIPNIPRVSGFGQATVAGAAIGTAVAPGVGTAVGAGAGLLIDAISFGISQYYNSKSEAKQLREVRRVQQAQKRQGEAALRESRRRFEINTAFGQEQFAFTKEQTEKNNKIAKFQRLRELMLAEMSKKVEFTEIFRRRGVI